MILLSKDTSDAVALVVAAGRGYRFGNEIPKQYIKIRGMSLLKRCLLVLDSHPRIDNIRVVIHPNDIGLYKEATLGIKLLSPVFGGKERQESVRRGLESLNEINPRHVLIHDAVRPFIKNEIIDSLFDSLDNRKPAVIPGLLVNDSLKRAKNNRVTASVDRSNLWQVQTPQGFDYKNIMKAHEALIGQNFTDDAAIAETNGMSVEIIEGSVENFKITAPQDLVRAENFLNLSSANQVVQVGLGFDVHEFKPGNFITLCGVKIPFNKSLKGHSDADVAMHAITDALLGAIGGGDIGLIFPPTDPKWKNATSDTFLSYAGNELRVRDGSITNIDLTIICEKPKISTYRDLMALNIAKILKIEKEKVNIKATTTEKLGFIGRKEGIAAQAITAIQV